MKKIMLMMTLLFAAAAVAQTYYVAPTGNDSNDGLTPQTAWATINHADASLVVGASGALVHVAPGTYNVTVTTNKSGTSSSARVVFISDTKWGAKIVAPSGNAAWSSTGAYVDIVGFDITGAAPVRNGITSAASHVRVLNNYIHDITGFCDSNGGAAFTVGSYTITDQQLIGNLVVRMGPGSPPGTTACSGVHGLYMSVPGGVIENNIVAQISGWGIHAWHAASAEVISNNTVIGGLDGGILNGSGDTACSNNNGTVINNNVLVANRVGIAVEVNSGCTVTNPIFTDNLFYQNTLANYGSPLYGTPAGTVVGDPKFVNSHFDGSGDYHLQTGSPAIDAGTASNAPTTDFDGNVRPQGSAWDIGAYEYGATAASVPNPPAGLMATVH